MAKFSGYLAIVDEYLDDTGVFTPIVKKEKIAGDLTDYKVDSNSGEKINSDLRVSGKFSIIATPKIVGLVAESQKSKTLYIEYLGMKLKVSSISLNLPRLSFSVGEFYNGIE